MTALRPASSDPARGLGEAVEDAFFAILDTLEDAFFAIIDAPHDFRVALYRLQLEVLTIWLLFRLRRELARLRRAEGHCGRTIIVHDA
ncbi:MAG: hypothetical protein WBD02_05065 [Acidimicrobiia bacterium]